MDIDYVIRRLQQAQEPSRNLDRIVSDLLARLKGEDPESDPAKVPHYTRVIDAALILSKTLLPSNIGGFSWGRRVPCKAQLDDGSIYEAATPALAICIAALSEFSKKYSI